MKHIQKQIAYINKNNFIDEIFSENSLFFDIETTGFSRTKDTIYLIGCLRKKDGLFFIEQFFAQSQEEEKEVLEEFFKLLEQYHSIITFNGSGFDLPFIEKRCEFHHLHTKQPLCNLSHLDIFKEIGSIKFLLNLVNYKQKTIENFLGIYREDKYSGGELIPIYKEYGKTKSPQAEELLLLHNYEDVAGMLDLLPILTYSKILNGSYSLKNTEITPYTDYHGKKRLELIFTLEHPYSVPKRVSCQHENYYGILDAATTKIRVSIYEGELKYFYPNYKDYYYLPMEDMAIHQSVAEFVDKQYREKAKAKNCYTRKTGRFLPQYDTVVTPALKKEYKDKVSYFELTEEFLSSESMMKNYIHHIFHTLRK